MAGGALGKCSDSWIGGGQGLKGIPCLSAKLNFYIKKAIKTQYGHTGLKYQLLGRLKKKDHKFKTSIGSQVNLRAA